jgi:FxsC-like protein
MTGSSSAPQGPGSYFFLSYAHSPPLAGNLETDPARWVRRFFNDLTRAVRDLAPDSPATPGFFDQDIPVGSDWKASLTAALRTTQVFVPLYSPAYFARSLPGREWTCFYTRMTLAGLPDPMQRVAPVLWIPLPGEQEHRPGLAEALAIGADHPAYAENGLRALLRLSPYRASYQAVVARLAEQIARLAISAPLAPSDVPDIDSVRSAFDAEAAAAVFAVAVAAPTLRALPDGAQPDRYGAEGTGWRPFPGDQELPLAEYAAAVAERLDFAVMVTGIEKTGDLLSSRPGVILIDPWFVADRARLRLLEEFLRDLPSWVLPVLIVDPAPDGRATELTTQARAILTEAGVARTETARRGVKGISSLREFVMLMPIFVAEAERQYLHLGPVQRITARRDSRPRLLIGGPVVTAPPPERPKEEPDD